MNHDEKGPEAIVWGLFSLAGIVLIVVRLVIELH